MPQLIIEYSSNLLKKEEKFNFLKELNYFLSEELNTELSACKSRMVERDVYCIGDGNEKNSFIHVDLKVMAGRNIEKLTTLGNKMLLVLKNHFHQSSSQMNLQISLEISELEKTYFKLVF